MSDEQDPQAALAAVPESQPSPADALRLALERLGDAATAFAADADRQRQGKVVATGAAARASEPVGATPESELMAALRQARAALAAVPPEAEKTEGEPVTEAGRSHVKWLASETGDQPEQWWPEVRAIEAEAAAAQGRALTARDVWQAWFDGMVQQGRLDSIALVRQSWDTLPEREKALDEYIVARLAADSGVPAEPLSEGDRS